MNTTTIQVQDRGVITIPKKLREALGLDKGDLLNVELSDSGEVILSRAETIDKSILESSQKALKELREGKASGPFASMEEFHKYLESKN